MGMFSLIIFAVFFYFMMRFGCGSHMTHGNHDHTGSKQYFDPVSGELVKDDSGYGKIIDGQLYRFVSKDNLDLFDKDPNRYINQ